MNQRTTPEGYVISTDKSLLQINVVHHYLSNDSYWAANIPLETVQRSIEHSFCFGIYRNEQQVGFARVITDHATFAYLADVFILPQHRGKGLSKSMMHEIHDHPQLQGLRRWMLATRDAHDLYKQFGWQEITEEQRGRLMQKLFPYVFKNQ
jgi:GNAT superfamily N-acetyltransferase